MSDPRVLTVRQPWAFALAEGFKTVENTRNTHHRSRVLTHAGLTTDDGASIVRYSRAAAARLDQLGGRSNLWDARALVPSRVCPPPPASLARGAIIATAELTGAHRAEACCGPWGFAGCWHWTLAHVVPLPTPVPATGRLGLWGPELLAAVDEQLTEVTS